MHHSTRTRIAWISAAAVTVALVLPTAAQAGKPTSTSGSKTSTVTGQGVYGEIKAAGSFLVTENNTYSFNDLTGDSFFTTTVTGPVVTKSACGKNDVNCADSNLPATPSQPKEDPVRRYDASVQNMCTFANGGILKGTGAYTQSVTLKGLNGAGNFTFTWTYKTDPKEATKVVEPLTAWDLIDSSGPQTAHVAINGWVAAQSAMTSSQFPSINGAPGKVSFSLDLTRVTNLSISVAGTTIDGTAVSETKATYANAIVQGQDFPFLAKYGVNGTAPLLLGQSALNDILRADSTTSNDSESNLYFAQIAAAGFDLLPGDYTFTFSGVVKDVSATSTSSFTVTKVVHVMTNGCSVPQP